MKAYDIHIHNAFFDVNVLEIKKKYGNDTTKNWDDHNNYNTIYDTFIWTDAAYYKPVF